MIGGARAHSELLAALGVPDEIAAGLGVYLELVADWNRRTNLTAAKSPVERVKILVADAWRAAPLIPAGSLIDIGSGNGSPGMVLAIARPELTVTLLEPRARRWAFLREVARALGRGDVEVVRARCEEFDRTGNAVTMRAVGLDLMTAARLLAPGGEMFVFGGQPQRPPSALTAVQIHHLEGTVVHHFRRMGA